MLVKKIIMYHTFKKIITQIIPRKLLFEQEENIRKIYSIFYGGNKFECNVCNKNLNQFIESKTHDFLCPNCGSLELNRRLWDLLQHDFLKENYKVLDFSPSRCLYRKLKKYPKIIYHSTDLSNDFVADFNYDITKLPIENDTYDLIICYHILEHIIDDVTAMNELFRVLKPGGKTLVQTPFKEGEIYEDYSIVTEGERLNHFGQEDHVRIYSVLGLKNRLSNAGFEVEILENFKDDTKYKLNPLEKVLVLTKPIN